MQVASIEHVEQQLKVAEAKARLTQMASSKFLTLYLCLQVGLLAANFCTNRLFNSPLLSLLQMVLIALFISLIIQTVSLQRRLDATNDLLILLVDQQQTLAQNSADETGMAVSNHSKSA